MTERQQSAIELQPQMINTLRLEFRTAVNDLNAALVLLNQRGYLSAPWLGDEESSQVAAHYTRSAMAAPGSSYQSLVAYRDELNRVHDTLQQMEDHYRRTEGDNAALWGRKA